MKRFGNLIRVSITPTFLLVNALSATQDITVDLPGGTTMSFVWIDPGKFMMGSSSSEWQHLENEGPQHEVSISRGFYLGTTEVTQGQWESVMGTEPWMDHFTGNAVRDQLELNPVHPAVWVSWSDAQSFMEALNIASDKSLYRLPTEAEWEYSARAGTTTMWSFGDDYFNQLKKYAWIWPNLYSAVADYNTKGAQPVAMKLPNPWGLHDMHGNVEEWCQNWFGSYSIDSQIDPWGPKEGTNRVVRGGSFRTRKWEQYRLAFRYGIYLGNGNNNIGFRVLMMEPQSSVPTVVNSRSWGLIKADK